MAWGGAEFLGVWHYYLNMARVLTAHGPGAQVCIFYPSVLPSVPMRARPATLQAIVLASKTTDGQPASGLRFADPRVRALLASLCHYWHLFAGLNRSLRAPLARLRPNARSANQAGRNRGLKR